MPERYTPTPYLDERQADTTTGRSVIFGDLTFDPLAEDNYELLAPPVLDAINQTPDPSRFLVVAINPDTYVPQPAQTTKCIIVASSSTAEDRSALVVPGDTQVDFKTARQRLGIRRVSMVDETLVEELSGMTRGSITPFGLPPDWLKLVAQEFVPRRRVLTGTGLRWSKMLVSGVQLANIPNVNVVPGLTKNITG
jgi:prolyl-tRNA editing enzyme YbaK/EbsC (Cys-tRNA(Pro) deacylase)